MELNVDSILSGRGSVTVGGVPTGAEALLLGELARQSPGRCVVHVARDDARMAATADLVGFFSPDAEVLTFPAWDCMPYDRVGPHRDIVARRIETLGRLLVAPTAAGGRIVVTTVNAAIQRVPSRAFMAQSVLAARVGARLEPDRVVAFLDECGYVRVETVGEAGEFAVRGGILDLFPPGREHPLRLDFFGDELEGIRTFEPLSQRTVGRRDEMLLLPVSELRLDAASIERFREGYRAQFGAVRGDDPLYQAVSAGRHYAGMEHWLPLFHDSLETLLDAAPEVIVTCDHQTDEARAARLDSIADFYAARLDTRRAEEAGGTPYKPLPPEQLYLNDAAWSAMLEGRLRVALTPFAAPGAALDLGGRPGETYAEARQKGQSQVLAEAGEDFDRARADGKAVLVAAYSTGSRDRLARLLRDAGIGELAMAASFAEARRAAPAAAVLVVLGVERGFALDDLVVVSEQDLLGERMVRPVRKRRRAENFLTEASALAAGDIVVHVDHGIGRYDGLEAIEVSGAPHDCLKVLYAEGDRLYVPVENIETLSRYGSEGSEVHLDRLGSAGWQTRKARVRKRLDAIAAGPWTGWCAATWASARPRWRCARPSSPRCPAARWRSWCRPRSCAGSISRPSRSALPGCRCASASCRVWSARPMRPRPARRWRTGPWTSSSAPMRCSANRSRFVTSGSSSSTRSSISASSRRNG
jgi:transcription-repair coupling factor (superfamily II helicase)